MSATSTAQAESYDVVVLGGGTAGAVAALAAARAGARTLVIESGSHIGGLAAIGMTWGGFFDNNHRRLIGGIPDELVQKAAELGGRGYFHYHGDGDKWITALASVDAEAARYIFEQELYEAGCKILLFSTLSGAEQADGRIQAVQTVSRLGTRWVRGRMFIDATGDMSLAALAGMEWDHGRDGFTQCVSNMFRVCGVDMHSYEEFLQNQVNDESRDPWKRETGAIRRGIEYWCPWKPDGFEHMPKSLGIYYHGVDSDVILNCTAASIDPLDPMALSRASFQLRREAFQVLAYLKEKVPAFQNAYIAQVYDVGVREGRRMRGDTVITLQDVVEHTKFPDRIGMGAYPPDVHNPDGQVHISSTREYKGDSDGGYDLPLSALTAPGFPNLLVAGRCASSTFEAQSAIRGIGPCMVEGQGAGTAAALLLQSGVDDIHHLDIPALQRRLAADGVLLD